MPERTRGLLLTVANPFAQVRVDNAWDAVTDVESINGAAFRTCLEVIEDVRRGGGSHGLLLSGRPGSGKTHLLARLRRQLVAGERAWFTYVLPVTAPERFFRHVLQALAGDVLRSPGDGQPTQAEAALARLLGPALAPGRVPDGAAGIAAWWRHLRARHADAHALLGELRAALAPALEAHELDATVADVLLQFVARVHRSDAHAWLLGRSVTETQAERLGVAATLDDEDAALGALVTLLRLAGREHPVVLTFDQIEGLQRDRADTQGLVSVGHGVSALFARCRNVVAITCAQISFLADLRAAVGEALYDGRLAERRDALQPLDAEQAVALAQRRLATSEDVQQVKIWARERTPHYGDTGDALWPLSSADVRLLALGGDKPARDVMQKCRELFEAARSGALPAAPVSAEERLREVWEAALARERDTPRDVLDEGVYADGLLRVWDLLGTLRAERSTTRDVDVFLDTPRGRTAVSVCHAGHMTSLAARLRRLEQALESGRIQRLVLLRDGRLPIAPTAKATHAHLERLQARGVLLLRPPAEAYAALAAIRALLAEAAAGDLAVDGRTLPPEDLKTWLARHLPAVLHDLHDALVAPLPGGGPVDDTTLRLIEAVRAERVVALDGAAQRAGITPDEAREALPRSAHAVGRLHGPPEVLFMHPDALERH